MKNKTPLPSYKTIEVPPTYVENQKFGLRPQQQPPSSVGYEKKSLD